MARRDRATHERATVTPTMPRLLVPAMLVLLIATGCASTRQTQPPRTATEQLLISKAAEDAADNLWLASLRGASIFLSDERFDSFDKAYAVGAIRAELVRRGAFLVDERSRAEVLVEVRSGALSINKSDNLILGLPSIELPVPFTTALRLPEIPLLKREHQSGIAKFALLAYDTRTGALVGSTGPVYGESYLTRWRILLIPWTRTDLRPFTD